ncbi:MAG TPA: pyruvate:ferredoxin (flavodoxin) oxidoreductase, partial [Acidimicrobiia bacterium]|nr:pyruvate:ferredoxin (flavodoxin) oxidoreductase [Acidimicrobiia bacterium]
RLYRPFPGAACAAALPPTVRGIAVLDRTKEPGAPGEPLYLDVLAALAASDRRPSCVIGGRYGLASKEFTPAMVEAALDACAGEKPRHGFTVGIVDDVTHTSLPYDPEFCTDHARLRAMFFGLGADGTVGANKQTAKIVGAHTALQVQAYFVYDSKKSGSTTVSHLRFDDAPIRSTYLIEHANFIACHQFGLLDRLDVLACAAPGATFLLNSPYPVEATWDRLPREVQEQVISLGLEVHVIDAHRVAREAGLAGQINTVMQACFFALTDVMPPDDALAAMRESVAVAYGRLGASVVEANVAAIDNALAALHRLVVPATVTATNGRRPAVDADAPDFVQRVTARMLEGRGDLLPVSALPVDGEFPTGTARYEKRRLAATIPVWDPGLCIDCARCTLVCPHAAIRLKLCRPDALDDVDLPAKPFRAREHPGLLLTIQVAPDDCTGCGICVDVCPAKSKSDADHKALDMAPVAPIAERERTRWQAFLDTEAVPADTLDPATPKGSQAREPLFEFSGACAGCGETPYLKLLTQLFGDHLIVANATGCSSIYGGNLPTTPWAVDAHGRGPAWSNSLFEDNAEFGLGIRMALDRQIDEARRLAGALSPALPPGLAEHILAVDPRAAADDRALAAQRARVAELDAALLEIDDPRARLLAPLTSALVHKSVWIVGGDGWAYDIGAGGLDHVLGSGRDVNVLVLDTEVYSNTGGQASKATPRGATAKFATSGKSTAKKDIGAEARRYGNVYVAQIAIGANDVQAVKAFAEAEAWPGPSLIVAYSTCIAHGIDMETSMSLQRDAVRSGYWPLYRYHPSDGEHAHPLQLDARPPSLPLADFALQEARFAVLARTHAEHAAELFELAQADVDERRRYYEQLAGVERTVPHHETGA